MNMIKISIKDSGGKTVKCEPFDYDKYPGEIFKKTITIPVEVTKSDILFNKNEITIYLKLFPKVSIERAPVIISNNRRVMEIYQIKSFRTNNKRELWNSPSITGYIDTKGLLSPTLARNDFKNDKVFRLVKKAILETEPEILEKFRKAAERINSGDFSEIESKFNANFKSLIEIPDEERSELKQGDTVKISDAGTKLIDVLIPKSDGLTTSEINSSGSKRKGEKGNRSHEEKEKLSIKMDTIREFIEPPKGNQHNLFLKIDDTSEPIKDTDGKEKRSELFGNIVTIYKKHPDFENRISKNSVGVEIITTELITYIASEMLVHFTNFSFEQTGKNMSVDRKSILIFFTDWLYRLEDSLKNLIGKQLSK